MAKVKDLKWNECQKENLRVPACRDNKGKFSVAAKGGKKKSRKPAKAKGLPKPPAKCTDKPRWNSRLKRCQCHKKGTVKGARQMIKTKYCKRK